MKRLILSLATAAAVAAPLAFTATSAAADDRRGRHEQRWDRQEHRQDRWGRRDDRRDDLWDRRDNRWYYGPPPQAYYGSPAYRPGYTAWRRGAHLPPDYRGYVVNDYYRYHLRQPPRGYAWYRVGDDYLLAAIASGVIFDIITN